MPPRSAPSADAKIAWVDVDAAQSRYKTMEWCADVVMPATTAGAARAIYDAATALLTTSDMSRIADRRARLETRRRELEAQWEREAQAAGKRNPIHPRWAAYQLSQILEPDAILLDDAVTNGGYLDPYHRRDQPGTFFSSGGSGGGWGPGAAFGAKIAAPDRDVVLAAGDGFFIFGEPISALWSAANDKAPFLTMVFANRSYSTGTNGLRRSFPEGVAVELGDFAGGVFDPPPDFAKIAEVAGGYGETVREPEDVGPALRRGLDAVRKGSPAVIAVWLPTHVEEMAMAR
jgi:acetolactate synthase-1/2/3 large subunit